MGISYTWTRLAALQAGGTHKSSHQNSILAEQQRTWAGRRMVVEHTTVSQMLLEEASGESAMEEKKVSKERE